MDNTLLINDVLKLQQELAHHLGQFAHESWKQLDVPLAQLKSLFIINYKGKTNFKKLSDDLGVTPSDVTGIVDRLVEQGLVSRGEDPQDRRVIVLQATDKGRSLLANLRESSAQRMAPILGGLSPEELGSLCRGLSALIRELKRTNEKSGVPAPASVSVNE